MSSCDESESLNTPRPRDSVPSAPPAPPADPAEPKGHPPATVPAQGPAQPPVQNNQRPAPAPAPAPMRTTWGAWTLAVLSDPVFVVCAAIFLAFFHDLKTPLFEAEMLPQSYSQKSTDELAITEEARMGLTEAFITLRQHNVDRVVLALLGPQGIGKTMTRDGYRLLCQNRYVPPTAQKQKKDHSDTKSVSYLDLTVGADDITSKFDICNGLVISDIEGAKEGETLSEDQVDMLVHLLNGTLKEGSTLGKLETEARHQRGYTVVVPAVLINGQALGEFDSTLLNQYKEIIKRVVPNKQPLVYITMSGREIPAEELSKVNGNFTALSDRINERQYFDLTSQHDISYPQETMVHLSPYHLTSKRGAPPKGMMERFVEEELSVVFQTAANWAEDMKKGLGRKQSFVEDVLGKQVQRWWVQLITTRQGKILTRSSCLLALALLVRILRVTLEFLGLGFILAMKERSKN